MLTKRNSNIELLRIISIIMIVVSHYCIHGVGRSTISNLSIGFNRFILEFLVLGNIGTVLFVLISGYFLINSTGVKLKKIIRLLFQVHFYSFVIYLILVFTNLIQFDVIFIIKAFFPITFKQYWFITAYFIIYLFHPYINKLLNSFTKREYLLFLSLMFVIFCILNTLTTQDYYGNELIQFLLFYSIGAYLSKYPKNKLPKNHLNVKLLICSILVFIISIIVFDVIGSYKAVVGLHSNYLLNRTSPFVIIFCISLFDLLIQRKCFENKVINFISSLVLGVYLLSDNRFLRPIIWNDIFHNTDFIDSSYLIVHIMSTIIIITISCLLIELIRKLFENKLFELLDKHIDALECKMKKIIYSKI